MNLLDRSGNTLVKNSTGIIEMRDLCAWNRDWHTADVSFSEIPDNTVYIKVEHG